MVNSRKMNLPLFNLTLRTILRRKTFVIFALLTGLLPFLLPLLTPWELDHGLLQPARAQAVWSLLWFTMLTWLLFQCAGFGRQVVATGLGAYLKGCGLNPWKQLFQIWLGCQAIWLGMLLLPVLVCVFTASPLDPLEAKLWLYTNIQFFITVWIISAPLSLLAIALGSRYSATVAYLIPAGLALYGLYGLWYVQLVRANVENVLLDVLWVFSPHYHLGDLTNRLVFKEGSLNVADFTAVSGYLGLHAVALGIISLIFFRPTTKSGK